jgi:hypothetical protein
MCGIIYARTKKKGGNAASIAIQKYHEQSHRGKSGFGFVAVKDGKVISVQRDTGEEGILKKLKPIVADEIIFHHRIPTSTPNFEETAHPIQVNIPESDFTYYLIHNGIIENAWSMKEYHNALGVEYTTVITKKYIAKATGNEYDYEMFNDSEALAVDIALFAEGIVKKITAKGDAAFLCYKIRKSDSTVVSLYYGRNYGNPLTAQSTKNTQVFASEGGDMSIQPDKLFCYDYASDSVEITDLIFPCTRVIDSAPKKVYSSSKFEDRIDQLEDDFYSTIDEYGRDIEVLDVEREEIVNELYALEEELKHARANNDYDSEIEIAEEIQEKKDELAAIDADVLNKMEAGQYS